MRIGGWLCRNARGICGYCGGSWSRDWVRGSRKKAFTHAERGENKFTFSHRKVFWDMVEDMVKRGNTSDIAIDRIYRVYGWNNSVTKVLNKMRKDKKRGVRRV